MISFGLVSIPVKLYTATSPSAGVSFNLLHKKCGSRLKQQYLCSKDGEKVEREDMIKGYEFAKDQYVTFTKEELEALEEKASPAIEIVEFIPAAEVDPIYFEKPYYLGPDKGGDKPYKLLAKVLQQTGRSALARWAARGKQHLVLIRPMGSGLVMQQLLYSDEVRPFAEVPLGEAEVKDAELKLAQQLVEQTASDRFQPDAYSDEVRGRVQELIQKKIEGQEVSFAPIEGPKAQIIDLMEALKASLAKTPEARPAAAPEPEKEERKAPKRAHGRRSDEAAEKKSAKK
jgi:DNA end-binding protein Ku